MPFLLRIIAQRLLFVVLSSATFLGLNTEIDIPTTEEAEIATEERKEIIAETLPITETITKASVPLPKINILNLPEADETHITDTKSTAPKIQPAPIKTPVIKITEKIITEAPKPQIQIPTTIPVTETASKKENIVIVPPADIPDNSAVNSIENVIVNILCIKQSGNKINLSTGSGVIISSKGVVLTNAHVAQHFLLKDAGYNCTLRQENIPTYGYNAIPLYISEKWIENNYKNINSASPIGTGEDDYALLLITGNTNSTLSNPSSFPTLPLKTESGFVDVGDTVTIAGYPGKITSSLDIAKNTSLQTAKLKIKEVFTLGTNSIDVVSTNESEMAKRGVSGGGLFKNNYLAGILVSTNPGINGQNVANALTIDYINRDLKKETGKSLSNYLSGDLNSQAEDFASVAPHLTELLMRSL